MRPQLLALLTAAAACSGGGPTDAGTPVLNPATQSAITLRNDTSEPLVYLAAGEGSLALLDIASVLQPGSYEDQEVGPGQSVPVTEIIGYDSKLGVNFFIWRVDRSSRTAYYARVHLATAAEIAAADGLVRITTLAP